MSTLPMLVIIAVLGPTPIDRAELGKAQSSLESYYSRIKTLHLTYTEKSTPADTNDYRLKHPTWDPALSNDHDFLYAYPSLRMKIIERQNDKDGKLTEHIWEARCHKGERSDIDYTSKAFNRITSSDPNPFPSLPIGPLGLRVLHTLNTPISEFLKYPEITSLVGEDRIDDERVILLKVGPGIPLDTRPKGWSDESVLRLWLAPERNYLPVRTEIFRRVKTNPDAVLRLTAGTFREVQDIARGSSVPFPHAMEITWSNGRTNSWTIRSAVINPPVSDQDFVLQPPTGYFVALNGTAQTVSGGTTQREVRISESVDEANRLLGSLDPPRASREFWLSWPIGIGVVGVLLLAAVFLFKWRNRS